MFRSAEIIIRRPTNTYMSLLNFLLKLIYFFTFTSNIIIQIFNLNFMYRVSRIISCCVGGSHLIFAVFGATKVSEEAR
jgi:hypothetical protein